MPAPAWEDDRFGLYLIPAFSDNYIYLFVHRTSGECLVVDPGEAERGADFIQGNGLSLRAIWLTHHHDDHIGGAVALKRRCGGALTGHAADRHRLPPLDRAVTPGETLAFHESAFDVIATPGHTLGHIAYASRDPALLFCGDTLFSLGCGRLFEGTPEQMFESLGTLRRLPPETLICAGHEYTLANARFARTVDPENEALRLQAGRAQALRAAHAPSLPVTLADESLANPFLRAGSAERLAELRQAKDRY